MESLSKALLLTGLDRQVSLTRGKLELIGHFTIVNLWWKVIRQSCQKVFEKMHSNCGLFLIYMTLKIPSWNVQKLIQSNAIDRNTSSCAASAPPLITDGLAFLLGRFAEEKKLLFVYIFTKTELYYNNQIWEVHSQLKILQKYPPLSCLCYFNGSLGEDTFANFRSPIQNNGKQIYLDVI